jgi:hypothetical protein
MRRTRIDQAIFFLVLTTVIASIVHYVVVWRPDVALRYSSPAHVDAVWRLSPLLRGVQARAGRGKRVRRARADDVCPRAALRSTCACPPSTAPRRPQPQQQPRSASTSSEAATPAPEAPHHHHLS